MQILHAGPYDYQGLGGLKARCQLCRVSRRQPLTLSSFHSLCEMRVDRNVFVK